MSHDPAAPHLTKSRHGLYCLRIPVPRSSTDAPRQVVQLSLGTRCPREAGRLLRSVLVQTEDYLTEAVAMQETTDYAVLRAKIQAHYRKALDEAKRLRSAKGPLTDAEKEAARENIRLWDTPNADLWSVLGRENARAELVKFCEAISLPMPTTTEAAMRLLDEIRKVKKAAAEGLLEHGLSLDSYDLSLGASAAPRETASPPVGLYPAQSDALPAKGPLATVSGPTLADAVASYFTEQVRLNAVTPSTIKKRRAVLDLAIEWFAPDCPVQSITKRNAAEFKDALLRLPANRSKRGRTRGLTLREAVKLEHVERISPTTINAHLSVLRLLWAWMEENGLVEAVLFDGLKVRAGKASKTERKPYTPEALKTIYTALTDRNSKYYRKTDLRWASLIGVFSGARLGEIAQLELADIKQDAETGIWVFDLTDEGDGKRLKTVSSKRRVPVHSRLLDLGLLEFIERRRAHGHQRLFPSFTWTEKAGYGDKLSKWFTRTFLPNLGLKEEGYVFHSLRHTMVTRLIQAGVSTEQVQYIVGHERAGITHGSYAREGYTVQQSKDAIERFTLLQTAI